MKQLTTIRPTAMRRKLPEEALADRVRIAAIVWGIFAGAVYAENFSTGDFQRNASPADTRLGIKTTSRRADNNRPALERTRIDINENPLGRQARWEWDGSRHADFAAYGGKMLLGSLPSPWSAAAMEAHLSLSLPDQHDTASLHASPTSTATGTSLGRQSPAEEAGRVSLVGRVGAPRGSKFREVLNRQAAPGDHCKEADFRQPNSAELNELFWEVVR